MNRKNGMKRRQNVKRSESVRLNGPACITLKVEKRKEGVVGRMDTGRGGVGIFSICSSADAQDSSI